MKTIMFFAVWMTIFCAMLGPVAFHLGFEKIAGSLCMIASIGILVVSYWSIRLSVKGLKL
jgi:hypothetical protein